MNARAHDAPLLALSLQATVLSHAHAREAGAAFASELASVCGCARVSIGFVHNTFIELAAVSHGGDEGLRGKAFEGLSAAMDEAVLQGTSVRLPADGVDPAIRLAHTRLLASHGGAVATVPIVYLGEVVGAVTCEWNTRPADFAMRVDELENTVSVAGPVLYLLHRHHAPMRRRVADATRRTVRRLRASEGRRLRWGLAAAAVAAVLLLMMPVDYRVGGQARIEGEQQRALVVPTDGFLKAVHARPGERVAAGQLLIEMADQDLLLQRRKWGSDLGQQENAYASALARADRPAMVIALARADEARAQLGLVDAELTRTRILSPFAGVVVDGDLSQALGAPLERGKQLMLLAPLERYRVVVQIDERDIARVRAGQAGTLALSALPWDGISIHVKRITPVARAVEGQNVFEVEAEVPADAKGILPGLQGVAKFSVGRAPLAWVGLHRFFDWARLVAWGWMP